TSVQVFLRGHAAALRRQGLYVPTTGTTDGQSGHHSLAWELYGDERFDPALGGAEELIEELGRSGAARAIVSAEDLEFLNVHPEALGRFDRMLGEAGWDPVYLAFFRRPEAYAVSLYGTLRARHKVRRCFLSYLRQILKDGAYRTGSEFYEFGRDRFAGRWQAATRPDCLRILDFDESLAAGGPVVALLRAIGIEDEALLAEAAKAPRENPGRRRWLEKRIMKMRSVRGRLDAAIHGPDAEPGPR
ncbi:MAG: hypothetical protein J0H63_04060, partial [Rhizobiales bacterium]|nr:hypothetical protein [Hyphomicrobiales bacterium]